MSRYLYEQVRFGRSLVTLEQTAAIAQEVAADAYRRAARDADPDIKRRLQRDAARAYARARQLVEELSSC